MSTHSIHVVGYVGRDPELRYTPSGDPVASFSVAVNEQYRTRNGETAKQTAWYVVIAWGKTAELCNQYLRRGNLVYVQGRPQFDPKTGGPRIWTSPDGTPKTSFEIRATTIRFLQRPPSGNNATPEYEAEEIPF